MANFIKINHDILKGLINLYKTGIEENYIVLRVYDTKKGNVATIAQKKPNNEIYLFDCYERNLKPVNDRTKEFQI